MFKEVSSQVKNKFTQKIVYFNFRPSLKYDTSK